MLVDLRGLIRGLHEHSVEYALIGAIAMVFYGYVRNTEDLDIVVNPDSENLDRVTEWLTSIDAVLKLNPSRPFGARERRGIQKGSNAPSSPHSARSTSCNGCPACRNGRS